MRLTVLGSSGTYPERDAPGSGYLLQEGADLLMLDAGPGTYLALLAELDRLGLSIADIAALVISHLHADHCSDVFALLHRLAYGPARSPLSLFLPPGGLERMAAFLDAADDHPLHRVFDPKEIVSGEYTAGELSLSFALGVHSEIDLVTRVITPGGQSLAYTGDTGPGEWTTHVAGVDVLLCEAGLDGTRAEAVYPHHLTPSEAGSIGAAANARELILTHLRPTVDPADAVAVASEAFGGPVRWARPGETFEIGDDRA